MKNFPIVFALVGFVLLMISCDKENLKPAAIKPSSAITSEAVAVTTFDRIEVSDDFEVEVTFTTDDTKVTVEANEYLQSVIMVEQQGATLQIRFANNTSISGNATTKIHIRVPELRSVQANDDTKVIFTNTLKTTTIDFDLKMMQI